MLRNKDVEAIRSGQDVGCVSGATTNCIRPTPEKTLGERTLALANELTLKQIWAVMGLKNNFLTGQEITENERQLAIASMISGGVLKVTSKGALELTEKGTQTLIQKYGSVEAKKIENNFNRDNDSITEAFNYGKTISLDPTKLSFSQATVSYQKGGKPYNYESMVKSMQKDGWNGDPVDIVIMPNGTATSMDNTRILAAREAGVNVQVKIRRF